MAKPRDKRAWADYTRLRRKPDKMCVSCRQVFPNDQAHFYVGPKGFITAHCLDCAAGPSAPVLEMCQMCQMCGRKAILVRDTAAPILVRVCRRCLMSANLVTHQSNFNRFVEYVKWRNQW